MADFNLTTVFVVPSTYSGSPLPTTVDTEALAPGQLAFFSSNDGTNDNDIWVKPSTSTTVGNAKYVYIAQGRSNTYLQGSKRTSKILKTKIKKLYKVTGNVVNPTISVTTTSGSATMTTTATTGQVKIGQILTGAGIPANSIVIAFTSGTSLTITNLATASASITATILVTQVSTISAFTVKPGQEISLTLRAFSSYLQTLFFNGLTRSVTIPTGCLTCGADPCTNVGNETVIDALIAAVNNDSNDVYGLTHAPNPDDLNLSSLFYFTKVGSTSSAVLYITAKPLNQYAQPCDPAAFPYEYDRLWFNTFVYLGADTMQDMLVPDKCVSVATVDVTNSYGQTVPYIQSVYNTGSSAEIAQLEKDYYSYQVGYLKHLFRMNGYNQNFESWVTPGTVYDTYYLIGSEVTDNAFESALPIDYGTIIAVPAGTTASTSVNTFLVALNSGNLLPEMS